MTNRTTWLLVNYTAPPAGMNEFPLGLAYISSTLKSDSRLTVHCLDLIDVPEEKYAEAITNALIETGAGVVGWAGYSSYYKALKNISFHVRQTLPEVTIVVGGPIVSSDPSFAFNHLDMDYGVCGEGEETALELASLLIDGGLPQEIAGLVFRGSDGNVVETAVRSPKLDIDKIPWPDWEGFNLSGYLDRQKEFSFSKFVFQTKEGMPRVAPMLLSRSCPFPCTFCMHSIKKYRGRKIDKTLEEIDFLVKNYNINGLNVMDDLFAVKRKRVSEFCQGITPYNLAWGTQFRPEMADSGMLEEMKKAGCHWVAYGFESYDPSVLKSMRKKTEPKQLDRASRLTYDSHITLLGNFIFGDIAETVETANRTVNWWARNRRYNITLATLLAYPGTELYREVRKLGKIPSEEEYYKTFPIFNMTSIPDSIFKPFLSEVVASAVSLHITSSITGLEVLGLNPPLLRVHSICPHCGETQAFSRVAAQSNIVVACHTCRGLFILSVLKKIHAAVFSKTHADLLHEAVELLQKQNFVQSYALAHQVTSAYHLDFNAQTIEGTILLISGKYRAALDRFRRATQVECSLTDAQNNFGIALCAVGHVGSGLLRFLKAIAIDPNNLQALANANYVGRWIGQHYETIPFVPTVPEFAEHVKNLSHTVPEVRSTTSAAVWPPLRTSGSNPFSGEALSRILGEKAVSGSSG